MIRIFLAGLLGGIAMFIWTSLAHMALPLGETGVREIPNESIVLEAMQTNIGAESGFYFFPGLGLGPNPTHEQKSEAMKHMNESLARHPSGILVYHPAGSRPVEMGKLLSVEFLTELIEAFLAVFLLAQTRLTSYGARVVFVTVIGIDRGDFDERFLLELVRFPGELHRGLHVDSVCRLPLRRLGCRACLGESEVRVSIQTL